jgi:hypothetical protein
MIQNGTGADSIAGGSGRDRLVHDGIAAPIDIDLARSEAEGIGGAGSDQISGIEALTGTPFADRLAGNDGRNQLAGAGGDDVLTGRGGDDFLDGGEGDDALSGDLGRDIVDGGVGRDVAGYKSSPGGVLVYLAAGGGGTSSAASGKDVLLGIEDVIGSPHNDNLLGNAGANRLAGGAGRDRLVGGPGTDALDGGEGDDGIESADGVHDIVNCGAGRDTVDADRSDTVASDCEAHGKPEKTRERGKPGSGEPAGAMQVRALTYRGRARVVRVRLRCPATARFACRGQIRIKARLRLHRRLKLRAVGRAQFKTILSGKSRTTAVVLRPAAQRALRRGRGRFKLVVMVPARDDRRTDVSVRVVRRAKRLNRA